MALSLLSQRLQSNFEGLCGTGKGHRNCSQTDLHSNPDSTIYSGIMNKLLSLSVSQLHRV